ncbi:MAG: hypothetical protein WC248_06370, partial [Candidatus Methanomethylophilaceae archaeon]
MAFADKAKEFINKIKNKGTAQDVEEELSSNDWKSPFIDGDVDADKVVADIKKEWDKRRENRVTREMQCQLNREFLIGNQYCDIDMTSRVVEEMPFVYDSEEREVFNLIAPKIESRLAKLNKAKPALVVRPASEAYSDLSTAKISTKIVRGTYSEVDMQERFKEANAWSEICGTVFHKDVWNPKKGRLLYRDGDEEVYEGGIDHVVVSFFEIYPESEYKERIEDNVSIFHARPMFVSEIEDLWGLKLAGREVDVYNLENSRISTGGMGYTASIMRYGKSKLDNSEIVIEAEYTACSKYPNGKLIIIVGDHLVVYVDNPWKDNNGRPCHSYTKQVCIREAGNFWGRTIIERLIPIQRRYNALKNRIHEYINMVSVPAWSIEQDALTDKDSVLANGIRSGDIIERRPGSEPLRALDMPNLNYEVSQEEARLRDLFTEISGVSDFASQSAIPSGTPGVGMELIKQQDDSRVSLTSENIEIAAKAIGRKWLYLYKQYVKVPRMTKVIGEDHTLAYILEWTNNDLTSFDVVLETDDLLTTSVAQKRQQVVFLLSQGLFHDPITKQIIPSMRAKLFETFELGNWEDVVSLENLHIRRANEENMYFKKGSIPQIHPLDEDDLHVREHTRYALSSEFDDMVRTMPGLNGLMLDHIQQHKNAAAQKLSGQPVMQQPEQLVSAQQLAM